MDESYSAYRHSPFYPNGLIISWDPNRMRWSSLAPLQKVQAPLIVCKKRERERDQKQAYKVIEITPPPKHLGIRCFAPNLQCGESVTIEGQTYTISAVTHRYQLRKGKYEPSEKRLDVLSTGRHILNLYFENLLQKS